MSCFVKLFDLIAIQLYKRPFDYIFKAMVRSITVQRVRR